MLPPNCLYIFTCSCVPMYVNMYVMYVCIYICKYLSSMKVCMHLCIYVTVYANMYVSICLSAYNNRENVTNILASSFVQHSLYVIRKCYINMIMIIIQYSYNHQTRKGLEFSFLSWGEKYFSVFKER